MFFRRSTRKIKGGKKHRPEHTLIVGDHNGVSFLHYFVVALRSEMLNMKYDDGIQSIILGSRARSVRIRIGATAKCVPVIVTR